MNFFDMRAFVMNNFPEEGREYTVSLPSGTITATKRAMVRFLSVAFVVNPDADMDALLAAVSRPRVPDGQLHLGLPKEG